MRLFEYAVIYDPSEAAVKKGDEPKLIVDVTRVLADSAEHVNIIASRAIPEEYLTKLDQVEIAVHPF